MDAKSDNGGAPRGNIVIRVMTWILDWSAAALLFFLMVWTFADVVAREAFNSPFDDTTDLTRLLLAAMVYAVLPIVSRYEQHVSVDLLDRWMPEWIVRPRQIAINLVAAVIMGVMAWQIWLIAIDKLEIGELTEFSEYPISPIFFIMSVMAGMTAITLLSTTIVYIQGRSPKEERAGSVGFD